LLQTTKSEVGNAYAYSQYILKTVRAKPLFTFLELDIKEYWDYLVWYDAFNYGGKGCTAVVEAENQSLDTIMNWQLATFLPIPLQPVFHDWVVDFIELMYGRKRPVAATDLEVSTPRVTQLPVRALTYDDTNVDADDPNSGLPKSFTRPLQKQIAAILRRQQTELLHPDLAADYSFPSFPGSSLRLSNANPTLHLIQSICQVLSLDRSINLQARQLRAELLKLLEIREFSEQASFRNPSASCVVKGLVCEECCSVRDLDLCRDIDVLPAPSTDGIMADNRSEKVLPRWKCQMCGSSFDRLGIEEKLIACVHRFFVLWTTQDLKCVRCGRLRTNEFMEHCACAGEWIETVKREEILKEVQILESVAQWYGLGMLEEVCKEVLKGNGLQ
jgi:DNA polymerase epsilon subunit 1